MIWDRSVSSQMGILRPWRLRAISAGIHHFTSLVDFIFREATGAGWATALFLGRAWLGPVSFRGSRDTPRAPHPTRTAGSGVPTRRACYKLGPTRPNQDDY